MFEKAGIPGWYALIPFLNTAMYMVVGGKPWWWFLLLLIPFVNFVILIIVHMGVAERFGHGAGFTLGLVFLTPLFIVILGWGDSQYQA